MRIGAAGGGHPHGMAVDEAAVIGNEAMRILVATDAWLPQVNGVVQSLQSLAANARKLGAEIEFLTPEGFRSFPLPTYRSVRCAIPTWAEIARRIERASPDALHIATEGPIGYVVRRYCIARGIPFTTSYMTRFPEYVSARLPVPLSWSYAVLRRFHAAAVVTMVSTQSLIEELGNRGFVHLAMWTRGVDTDLFRPERAVALDADYPEALWALGAYYVSLSHNDLLPAHEAIPRARAACSNPVGVAGNLAI